MQARLVEYFFRFLSVFSLRTAHRIGWVMGVVAYRLSGSLRRPLKINIDLCFPGLSERERRQLSRESFIEMCKAITECGALFTWDKDRILSLIRQISGEEHLREAFNRGKGVILALPHLGCWEMMSVYCPAHYPFTALYRPLRLAGLDPFVKSARERFGSTLVPTNATGIRSLYKALNNNEMIAILPDQDPGLEGSVFAPFCGIPASTMTLVPRLMEKTGAALIYGYAERLPDGTGYHIHFLPETHDFSNLELPSSAGLVNQGVEKCVRQLPQQYQWAYKRFKTRPEGQPPVY